jgi:hypothetical protein
MTKKIRLMVDYGCDPLWWDEPDKVGDIDPETLPLQEKTIEQLHNWAKMYDKTLDWDNPADSPGFANKQEEETFEKEGILLWKQVQKELADQYEISYYSQIFQQVYQNPFELELRISLDNLAINL